MKKIGLSQDFSLLMKNLSKKKEESVKDLEKLKKKVLHDIDSRIDKLYVKRDYIMEVLSHKTELRKLRIGVWKKIFQTNIFITLKYLISMPFIYVMILPGLIMHLFLEIYHQVCFRIYGIPLVKAKDFFTFDRRLLPYLNWLQKFNCFYCSYYNGLVSYLQEIVGRTERFWCPIKHARRITNPHTHYERFIEYSQTKNIQKDWKKLRKFDEFK